MFFTNHEYVLSINIVNWLTYKRAYHNNVWLQDNTGIEHPFITNNLTPASVITFLRNKMSVINIMYQRHLLDTSCATTEKPCREASLSWRHRRRSPAASWCWLVRAPSAARSCRCIGTSSKWSCCSRADPGSQSCTTAAPPAPKQTPHWDTKRETLRSRVRTTWNGVSRHEPRKTEIRKLIKGRISKYNPTKSFEISTDV